MYAYCLPDVLNLLAADKAKTLVLLYWPMETGTDILIAQLAWEGYNFALGPIPHPLLPANTLRTAHNPDRSEDLQHNTHRRYAIRSFVQPLFQ